MRYSLLFFLFCLSCSTDYKETAVSLADYQLADGFTLSVLAAEPLLQAPVALDFDERGRLWVVEMRGYMTDLDGSDEKDPSGRIVILEDRDGDGQMDHSHVFLDSLILPRALALVYGGLLYAEPPNLWFVTIEKDRPGPRTLVDSLYAFEGNVEHQPNGLLLNMDNWIYSAKSNARYQRRAGVWHKETTSVRGQWGIAHDDMGHLYSNNNSQLLRGDLLLPDLLLRNRYHVPATGIDNLLTQSQQVSPLHATAINRGYQPGVLDADSMLIAATSACGPLIYRGGLFPADYAGNAFVCIPEANLIKRLLLAPAGDSLIASPAWPDREFLAATDEGFRPVNLANGPDGALYVVDMHRGVIQHQAYMSPYLRTKLARTELDTLVHAGRILRVAPPQDTAAALPDWSTLSVAEKVTWLRHPNGWRRDQAQHRLIYQQTSAAIPALETLAADTTAPLAQIHALWTLEGLSALTPGLLFAVARSSTHQVVAHALYLLDSRAAPAYQAAMTDLVAALRARHNRTIDLYLVATLGTWAREVSTDFLHLLPDLPADPFWQTALLSGLGGVETIYLKQTTDTASQAMTKIVIANRAADRLNPLFTEPLVDGDSRTMGWELFRTYCAACHGADGNGMNGLAPPLRESEYVSGPVEQVAAILLYGLSGPLEVNGVRYTTFGDMPGLAGNPHLTDADIAAIIQYLRNAFSRAPLDATPLLIEQIRSKGPPEGGMFTQESLHKQWGTR